MVCPRPSIVGESEYALIIVSWSIVIAQPVYVEKHIVVTASVPYAISLTPPPMTCALQHDAPRVRLSTTLFMSRMSVAHSTPSYPPLTITVGSSAVSSPCAEYAGARTHARLRIADWCAVKKCVGSSARWTDAKHQHGCIRRGFLERTLCGVHAEGRNNVVHGDSAYMRRKRMSNLLWCESRE